MTDSHIPRLAPHEVRDHLKPVIVGGDILAYSYVRELNRAYGIPTCIVLATQDVKMLSASRFTDYRMGVNVHDAESLCAALESIAAELTAADARAVPLILGCDDVHARMISRAKARLQAAGYAVPYIDFELLDTITQKRNFYDICEKLDIPYPKTWYFSCGPDGPEKLPVADFPYPLIAKPSNSAQFQEATIKGWRKIYEIESPEELADVWQSIRTSDYDNELVLQDFIPGGDEAIRTLTTFSDATGDVRVVSGGVVCLQDHDPTALGNPVCIMGQREEAVIENAQKMLRELGYRGFANFDVKYDARDGSFRFFEVNTRCGRNTYYMSLGGVNFTTLIVREFVTGEAIPREEAYRPFVFSVVPPYVLKRSVSDAALLAQCLTTLRKTTDPYVLSYAPDTAAHNLWAKVMYENQIRKFKRFYWDTDGKQLKQGVRE
ncbi:carboxylate--amine ligase [Xiamenia xianingshaonis]|uniref:ATP-grasp domain-containing protein n=1 Tax=Xiamenia xianingshaonis TaxID=2682776 RepID=A0A9E6MP93_9ACTN|nr:ATP-grasp domain-containing protein [Xiamenia xianingshaonis]NHM13977.1 carboxylate--amine ligase [Xiamenia xianingshaonis]QTU83853.1 ATP-grasp domain-containing protein [Xiamenia xianingshaonis]